MPPLILDPDLESQIKADRALTGADKYDEVWEGTYMMAPLADDEHQDFQAGLIGAFLSVAPKTFGVLVRGGVNVSDRALNWKDNYRCPDIAVFLPGTAARCHGPFWQGGPDFAVQIVSPYDRSREKIPFYASVHTRELLLLDRHPWSLELYRLDPNHNLPLIARSTPADQTTISSTLFPLTLELTPNPATPTRPTLRVTRTDTHAHWDL